MEQAQALKAFLDQPRRIVITTHHKPDADALGSSLGLAGYLKKKGHQVQVITPSDYPNFLSWMPGNEEVIAYEPAKSALVAGKIKEAEIIFLFRLFSPVENLRHG